MDITKLFQTASSIKLSGGIFTKACTVLIIVVVSIAITAYFANNIWVSISAITLTFILTITVLWRLINFADKNPQAAILEGAHFLIHEQIKMSAKGKQLSIEKLTNVVEKIPIATDPNSLKEAEKPDLEDMSEKGKGVKNA